MVDYVVKQIEDGLYILSLRDNEVNYFEAAREIGHEGILYNAYLIRTNEGYVLIDGRKKEYTNLFEKALGEVLDKPIIAYIVNHSEPDHTGTFPYIIEKYKPKVYAHPFGIRLLKTFYGDFEGYAVKHNETIEIGGEKFTFYHAPRLHRPDTIVTERNDVRFTGDIFGAYYAFADPIYYERFEPDPDTGEPVSVKEIFIEEAAEYFSTVIGTYRTRGVSLLKLLEAKKPKVIAPAHALVRLNEDVDIAIDVYRRLILGESFEESVLLLYSTMYGFTLEVVDAVRETLENMGVEVRERGFNDRELARTPDILGNAYLAKKIIIVTSAYEAGLHPRIRYTLELMAKKVPARPILAFMTFGRGAAFDRDVQEKLEKAGFHVQIERYSIGKVDKEAIKKKVAEFVGE